jgi:hypothetical protein
MNRFEKHISSNWKIYVVGFAILFLIYIYAYGAATEHWIGKPNIDYNLSFDRIKCCMGYNELVPILGEGEGSIWDSDKLIIIKSDYRKDKINALNPVGNQTVLYYFSNGMYRIYAEGKEITRAYMELNIEGGSDILKEISGCVC